MPCVLFHANGGPEYGLGHIMRVVALAEEAMDQGWDARLIGIFDGRSRRLLAAQVPQLPVVDVAERRSLPAALSDQARSFRPDVFHLDTYWLAAEDVPLGGWRVSNQQDAEFGDRPADVHVDSALGAVRSSHRGEWLLGPEYAPIRQQVRRLRREPKLWRRVPRTLLMLGGADIGGHTADLASRLRSDFAGQLDLTIPEFVTDLPALAVEHDLVVCAGGTSTWDFMCMGVPIAMVCVADNQEEIYRHLIAARYASGLGNLVADRDLNLQPLAALLAEPGETQSMAIRSQQLVDGEGVRRIVDAWGAA